jgi:hypothetical protein
LKMAGTRYPWPPRRGIMPQWPPERLVTPKG